MKSGLTLESLIPTLASSVDELRSIMQTAAYNYGASRLDFLDDPEILATLNEDVAVLQRVLALSASLPIEPANEQELALLQQGELSPRLREQFAPYREYYRPPIAQQLNQTFA